MKTFKGAADRSFADTLPIQSFWLCPMRPQRLRQLEPVLLALVLTIYDLSLARLESILHTED